MKRRPLQGEKTYTCYTLSNPYLGITHAPLPKVLIFACNFSCTRPDPSPYQVGTSMKPFAPVAYQVILEPGIGQFHEFEPRRVHTRIIVGTFSCARIDLRKARER